jgi:uncharacterized membrane protein YjdF
LTFNIYPEHIDKVGHFSVNFMSAVVINGCIEHRKTKNIALISLVSVFILKEFLYDKEPNAWDMVANVLGVLAGCSINF